MSQIHKFKLPADLLAPFLALLISGGGMLWAYPRVLAFENSAGHLIFSIEGGNGHLSLVSDNGCLAKFSTVFTPEPDLHLRLSGTLKMELAGRALDAMVDYKAKFNPLGQLSQSALSVVAKGFFFRIQSKGVDPINLTISGDGKSAGIARTLRLPGPVLLGSSEKVSGRSRRAIYYRGFPQGFGLSSYDLSAKILRGSQLSTLRLAHDPLLCDSKPEARLNLDELLSALKPLGADAVIPSLKGA